MYARFFARIIGGKRLAFLPGNDGVKRILLVLGALFTLCWTITASGDQHDSSDASIVELMKRACDWQLAALASEHTGTHDTDNGWVRAAFFDGVMALIQTTHDPRYYDAMVRIGQENHWQPASRFRFADDLAIGQLYTELDLLKPEPIMIGPFQQRIDQIMAQPMAGKDDWYWCDSLFMAPPGLARLAAATGQRKYLDFMDRQWWSAVGFLYDRDEHLFFRDKSYFDKREKNGQKVFWSRGNGWVLAGIARILQYMPKDYPSRDKYVQLFTDMSKRIASLQQPDGFWRVSLLDPDEYPGGETSGTAMFCYAMAWGINQGILGQREYRPVVDRAWKALCGAVDSTGKVGWVQTVGKAPAAVKQSDTAEYGVGAFLLAGSEVVKMN